MATPERDIPGVVTTPRDCRTTHSEGRGRGMHMDATRSSSDAHESARRRAIDVLVAQGLDDIEAGRLDAHGAMRLVAEMAWDESSRLPVPDHAVLGHDTSGGPTRSASPSSSVADPLRVIP